MARFLAGFATAMLLWFVLPPVWMQLTPEARFATSPPGKNEPVVSLALRPRYYLDVRAYTLHWVFRHLEPSHFWAAWSDEGKHLSILICSPEGPTIEHLMPGASEDPWNTESAPGFTDSDAALERSLRAHLPVPENLEGKRVLSWFCGSGGQAFVRHYWPKGTAASTLPSR